MIEKPTSMSCGSACIYYLQEQFFHIKTLNCPDKLFWICDIANYLLNNTNLKISLSCFNSKLYLDYDKFGYKDSFDGFTSISRCLQHDLKIQEQKVSIKTIDKLLKEKKYIILNVSSSILNQDSTLNGGHYICVIGKQKNKYIIVNPKSRFIKVEKIEKNIIINACKSFGSWMLKIKRC